MSKEEDSWNLLETLEPTILLIFDSLKDNAFSFLRTLFRFAQDIDKVYVQTENMARSLAQFLPNVSYFSI